MLLQDIVSTVTIVLMKPADVLVKIWQVFCLLLWTCTYTIVNTSGLWLSNVCNGGFSVPVWWLLNVMRIADLCMVQTPVSNIGCVLLICAWFKPLYPILEGFRFLFLTLKVLNFWKFTSYCSLKPIWSGMGEVVPARTSPTLHPPSPPTVHQLSRLAL